MAQASREQIFVALFNLISGAYPWQSTSRRVKLWGDVPLDARPAFYLAENEPEQYRYSSGTVYGSQNRILKAKVVCYTDAKDPTVIGATELNNILDAVDNVLFPSGADAPTGKNTLGGLVDNCRIAGVSTVVPGDIDGDGILVVDVEIWMP